MKFLGFNISDLPDSVKLIYVLVFGGIVGGALFWGLSKLGNNEKPDKKRKKSPKKERKD